MSVDLIAAAKLMFRAGSELTTPQRFVLMVLCDSAWDDGLAHLKQRDISALTGLHRATVIRALEHLTAAGLIARKPQYRRDGGRAQDVYRVLIAPRSHRATGAPSTVRPHTRKGSTRKEGATDKKRDTESLRIDLPGGGTEVSVELAKLGRWKAEIADDLSFIDSIDPDEWGHA